MPIAGESTGLVDERPDDIAVVDRVPVAPRNALDREEQLARVEHLEMAHREMNAQRLSDQTSGHRVGVVIDADGSPSAHFDVEFAIFGESLHAQNRHRCELHRDLL